jgi:hypothetical protein
VLVVCPAPVLASRVLAVEFHRYHSRNWQALPVTLRSQQFGFELVDAAVGRGAVVVVLRAWREWQVAVPSLGSYPGVLHVSSHRRALVSKGNLKQASDWQRIVDAVTGGAGTRWRAGRRQAPGLGAVRFWTLAANPGAFRVEANVRELDEDLWRTRPSKVARGDRVAIYKCKGRDSYRGIPALGDVLTDRDSQAAAPDSEGDGWRAPGLDLRCRAFASS